MGESAHCRRTMEGSSPARTAASKGAPRRGIRVKPTVQIVAQIGIVWYSAPPECSIVRFTRTELFWSNPTWSERDLRGHRHKRVGDLYIGTRSPVVPRSSSTGICLAALQWSRPCRLPPRSSRPTPSGAQPPSTPLWHYRPRQAAAGGEQGRRCRCGAIYSSRGAMAVQRECAMAGTRAKGAGTVTLKPRTLYLAH